MVQVLDRTFRSLASLNGASTSRVLNLSTVATLASDDPDYKSLPFFKSPFINNAIILKHYLRSGEHSLFAKPKRIATKLILPFNKTDLRVGGRSIFIDQVKFQDALTVLGSYDADSQDLSDDIDVLRLIDSLPTLDPFIMREFLTTYDRKIGECYFIISRADQLEMKDYVSAQMRRLSDLATGAFESTSNDSTARLAVTLLHSTIDRKLEPLRRALRLEERQFRDGIFSWRGFLYYKWRTEKLWPEVVEIVQQIELVKPLGRLNLEKSSALTRLKETVSQKILGVADEATKVLAHYDDVFGKFTEGNDAKTFTEFLLAAPPMFLQLGEKIGAIEHVASFWKFRSADFLRQSIGVDEIIETLTDLSLTFPDD